MRSYPILLLALVALLFVACEKDTILPGENEKDQIQQFIDQAEQSVAQADAMLEQDLFVSERTPGVLEANSVNALQDAIDYVGPFGTVLVESGMHYESKTVKITFPVKIIGEYGAVIQSTTEVNAGLPYEMDPAIYLDGAERSEIRGINFVPDPATGTGGIGILVSNSDRVFIKDNEFTSYLQAVMVYASDFVRIHFNRAEGLYTEGFDSFNSYGFSVMSGKAAYLRGNVAKDFWANFFVSDKEGILYKNTATGGEYGFFFGNYREGNLELPGETSIGGDFAATKWIGLGNTGQNTVTGFLFIDGANNIKMTNNKALDYTSYGVDFAGDTERFGAVLPASFDNFFAVGGGDFWERDTEHNTWVEKIITWVKDCGLNNETYGIPDGRMVDTSVDICE